MWREVLRSECNARARKCEVRVCASARGLRCVGSRSLAFASRLFLARSWSERAFTSVLTRCRQSSPRNGPERCTRSLGRAQRACGAVEILWKRQSEGPGDPVCALRMSAGDTYPRTPPQNGTIITAIESLPRTTRRHKEEWTPVPGNWKRETE